MRSSLWDLALWLERLTTNAEVATVVGSIPASSDTVESEGRQMMQFWMQYRYIEKKNPINPPVNLHGTVPYNLELLLLLLIRI